MAAVANGRSGVLIEDAPRNLIGGPFQIGGLIEPGGNSIGGHSQQAIKISGAGAANNQVQGNRIGFDLYSQTIIPNRDGVRITDGTGNTVSRNSIHDNGGLGITIGGRAVTSNDLNDTDTGANDLQNFPVITSAVRSAGNTTISGTLNSVANSMFTVEFFSSPAADLSGHGEGEQYLSSTTVNTDGNGGGSFSPVLSVDVPSGHVITATATDSAGNTSEFSAAVTVSESLLAAAGPAAVRPAGGSPAGLTANQLQPNIDAAIDRLTAVGFAPELFANVEFAIADLPGAALGLATGNTITIDVNAAGCLAGRRRLR